MNTSQKIFTVIGSTAVIAAAGFGGYALFATPDTTATASSVISSSTQDTTTSSAATPATTNTSTSSESSSSYADGTYVASVNYSVPKGDVNSLSATITVTGGVITNLTVDNSYSDHESGRYISDFESLISSAVKGESLSSVSVSRVGGASLTSDAFNAVLDTIRADAKA